MGEKSKKTNPKKKDKKRSKYVAELASQRLLTGRNALCVRQTDGLSDSSKVRTYRLSTHNPPRFKLRT